MPADYNEVLQDLDSSIAKLEAEVATLRAARPTIVLLREKFNPAPTLVDPTAALGGGGPYAHMGPTGAIPLALRGEAFPLSTGQIADRLLAGGVRTKGQDFSGNVSATLGRLKDNGIVEKIGDGWRLKPAEEPFDHDVTVALGAEQSFSATRYRGLSNV